MVVMKKVMMRIFPTTIQFFLSAPVGIVRAATVLCLPAITDLTMQSAP